MTELKRRHVDEYRYTHAGAHQGAPRTAARTDERPVPRHRNGESFLKGPIPLNWLIAAGRLPGKATQVAIILWHMVGWLRKNELVFPTGRCARTFGIDRNTAARGLRALEAAGLVQVERGKCKSPRVVLLDAPKDVEVGRELAGTSS